MTAEFLTIRGLTKDFDGTRVLEPLDLDIPAGEFLTLLGPSGCGKTTMLRLIAGLEQPTGGEIRFRGRSLAGTPPERRPFDMVFQSYALLPHKDVADNVGYGLQAAGVPRREQTDRVAAALDLVGLAAFAGRHVKELSGGQQQRVALGRALINDPEVLLLDEPLAALDLELRKRLQEERRAIQQRIGATFVYVTHDQDEALKLSHRVALMTAGGIDQLATPRELYLAPRSMFAAQFVGDRTSWGARSRPQSQIASPSSSTPAGPRSRPLGPRMTRLRPAPGFTSRCALKTYA